jgi:1,4-alpha-glucan branching enzyme
VRGDTGRPAPVASSPEPPKPGPTPSGPTPSGPTPSGPTPSGPTPSGPTPSPDRGIAPDAQAGAPPRPAEPAEGGQLEAPVSSSGYSALSELDLHLFNEGTHDGLAHCLGSRIVGDGAYFAVWAPSARAVTVIGDWNGWNRGADPLRPRGSSGIFEGVVPGAAKGAVYKYAITTGSGEVLEKADPFAIYSEVAPRTGSVLWGIDYDWHDDEWMATRAGRASLSAPISIYELHLGSWRRSPESPGEPLGYKELAPQLVQYLSQTGFTHVELLPIMEHPFYGSWGYQCTGYFAPTSRYGTPEELMGLIDGLHQAGIGVILDWVPSHFPADSFALGEFDGTHLYEHADPRQGFHPDWHSYIFNYGRREVRSFLRSSAAYWLSAFHADGLRVDGVASMLYLDYSRQAGEWIPNPYGGRENLEAVSLLQELNTAVYRDHPGIQTIAEESTAWPKVSAPVELGGLGFGMKWDMGWMHDTLAYLSRDPIYRRYHHHELTFRGVYAFSENFVLPLSHDEVVHGKGSLLEKMPGDSWQRFANLRLLLAYQFTQPGKKLLFMGAEFGQEKEWDHDASLDWHLLGQGPHEGVARLVTDLNRLYRSEPALHELDCDPAGFEWVQADDGGMSTLSYLRFDTERHCVLVVCNFTPVPRHNLILGVPEGGQWRELLNTDAQVYGGSGVGNLGGVLAQPVPWYDRPRTVTVTAPPLSCVVFSHVEAALDPEQSVVARRS